MMINIKRLVFSVIMFMTLMVGASCKRAAADNEIIQHPGDEVRVPNVDEVSGKAVVTWIDPYIADAVSILVKDLQTSEEKTITLGVQRAEFEIGDNELLSHIYEIKVVRTAGEISAGIVVRMFNNWAQNIYDRIDYNSSALPQSGMFFKNSPVQTVKVFDLRQDESLARISAAAMQGVINQQYAYTYLVTQQHHLDQLVDAESSHDIQTPIAVLKTEVLPHCTVSIETNSNAWSFLTKTNSGHGAWH